MIGRGVARGLAQAFEGEGDHAQAGVLVAGHVLLQPAGKGFVLARLRQQALLGHALHRLGDQVNRRGDKTGAHAVEFGLRDGVLSACGQDALVFGLHFVDVALALGLDQNLDPGLVHVVASAPGVVDPHHGFQVIDDLVPGQKGTDFGADHRRAAHATAHENLEPDFTFYIR